MFGSLELCSNADNFAKIAAISSTKLHSGFAKVVPLKIPVRGEKNEDFSSIFEMTVLEEYLELGGGIW